MDSYAFSQHTPLHDLRQYLNRRPRARLSGSRRGPLLGLLAIYIAGYWLWLLTGPADTPLTRLIGNIVFIPPGLAAVVVAWRAGGRGGAYRPQTWAWRLVALAYLLDAVGNVIWLVYESALGITPFPSAADAAYLAYYPLLLGGLLLFPTSPRLRRSPTFWLDLGVVLLGGGMVVWSLVLAPVALQSAATWLEATLALAYPVGSLVVLFGIAAILLDPEPDPTGRPPALLLLGLGIGAVANLAYAVFTLNGTYYSGHWLDGVWAIAYGLVTVSAAQASSSDRMTSGRSGAREAVQAALRWLPYLGAAAGYGVLLAAALGSEHAGPLTALGATAIGVMSMARQALAERENTRLQTERATRAVEARYRALVEHADDVMLILDADGAVRYSSPAARHVFGRTPERLIGQPLIGLVDPQDAAVVAEIAQRILAGAGATTSTEARFTHVEGGMRTCVITWRNLLHDPDIAGVVVVCRDITARAAAEAALRASEQSLRTIFETAPVGMVLTDAAGKVTQVNPSFATMLQQPAPALLGRSLRELSPPEDLAQEHRASQVLDRPTAQYFTVEKRFLRADGLPVWTLLTATYLRDPLGAPVGRLGIVQDISQQRVAAAALRASEALNRDVLNALPAQLAVLDGSGEIVVVNGAWMETAQAGGDRGEIHTSIGTNYLEVCRRAAATDYDAALVLRGLEAVLRGELPLFTHEYPCPSPEGLRWYLLYATPLQHGRQGAVLAHLDISDRKHLEQERESLITQLYDLAHRDWLTGLANRRAFMDEAEREWQRAERSRQSLGLLLIDIDHFKRINDTCGHVTGDQVLRVVASRCRAAVRGADLVGRYGGEEFVILAPALSPAAAGELAERVRTAVAASPVVVEGHALAVTISAGAVVGRPPAHSLGAMLAAADAALYAAKRAGRDRIVVSTDGGPADDSQEG